MSPIYVKSAKNVCITLATGTVNTISDSSEYAYEDGEDEPAAAVYSKDDLTINGDGELIVNANYDKGIHSKDDLKIISGKITVNSVGDAIKGKDCLLIKDGEITITTGVDGLKSNNDSNEEKGYVIIEGGKINISAGDDAVHAESWLIVYGGEINITECYEGLEGKKVEIYGGGINIVSSDDSINAASGSSGDTDFTIPDRDFNFSNFNSEDGQTPHEMSDSDNTDGTRPEMPSGDFTTGDGQTPPKCPTATTPTEQDRKCRAVTLHPETDRHSPISLPATAPVMIPQAQALVKAVLADSEASAEAETADSMSLPRTECTSRYSAVILHSAAETTSLTQTELLKSPAAL